jgi:GMP synthase-like glutamine amidotransferase
MLKGIDTYNQYPQILFFGSCFGHQLICQALFTPSPPQTSIVTRSPHGWELGIHPIRLSPQFLAHFGPITNNENAPAGSDLVRMQFVHADHVSVSVMPKGFANIGSTEACEIQGVWKKNRVLTYQGHIEFDEFVNKETIKVFGTTCGWDNERMRCALEMTEGVDDAGWASSVLFKFLMEGIEERDERQRESVVVPLLVPVVRETCSAQNNVVEKGLDWKGVEVKEMEVGA